MDVVGRAENSPGDSVAQDGLEDTSRSKARRNVKECPGQRITGVTHYDVQVWLSSRAQGWWWERSYRTGFLMGSRLTRL